MYQTLTSLLVHLIFSTKNPGFHNLKRYIANQKEHYRKQTFQEELIQFLEEYGIEYDERYLWN